MNEENQSIFDRAQNSLGAFARNGQSQATSDAAAIAVIFDVAIKNIPRIADHVRIYAKDSVIALSSESGQEIPFKVLRVAIDSFKKETNHPGIWETQEDGSMVSTNRWLTSRLGDVIENVARVRGLERDVEVIQGNFITHLDAVSELGKLTDKIDGVSGLGILQGMLKGFTESIGHFSDRGSYHKHCPSDDDYKAIGDALERAGESLRKKEAGVVSTIKHIVGQETLGDELVRMGKRYKLPEAAIITVKVSAIQAVLSEELGVSLSRHR